MDAFADWHNRPVRVRKLTNSNPSDDSSSFAGPVDLMGMVEETLQIVRDSSGAEVLSTVTIHLPITDKGKVTAGSQIELPWSSRPDTVAISVADAEAGWDIDGVTVMCE